MIQFFNCRYVRHLKLNQIDLTAATGEKKPLVRKDTTSWETQF